MTTRIPQTLTEFRDLLKVVFDTIKDEHASGVYDPTEIANRVEDACILACRFGAGDVIAPRHQTMTPREALVAVGRLLAWAEKDLRSPSLNVQEMALHLACTERTVWRLEAKGLIPSARRVGRVVRWDREQIDDWLEKQATLN